MSLILVVDDDVNLRTLYEQEFEDDGFKVVGVGSGLEALAYIKSQRPDLVILDIAMPGMDGIDLLNRVLALDKSIPIILNTAYSNYKDNFMTWSADGYVVKSSDLDELKTKVKELLERAKPQPIGLKET